MFAADFPQAKLHLCLFHTLRSFSREVTQEKLGVRDALLATFNAMANACSEEVFEQQCALLEEMQVRSASRYFEHNWLHIKEEWVACHKSRHFTLGEQTNNQLESLNGKIKYVCTRYSSLDNFFTDFFYMQRVLRDERNHASVIALISRMASLAPDLEEQLYRNILTVYACRVVVEQLAKRAMITLPTNRGPFMSSDGLLDVTGNSFNCAFRLTRRLPCRHIFAQRLADGQPAFDASLVDDRWMARHSQAVMEASSDVAIRQLLPGPASVTLNSHQKYRKGMEVAADLANLMSQVGTAEFHVWLEILEGLRRDWVTTGSRQDKLPE